MKKTFILLVSTLLLLSSCKENVKAPEDKTVTDLGVETIRYGKVFKYVYDGNPFNNNEKKLTASRLDSFWNKYKGRYLSFRRPILSVSKSDLHPDKFLSPAVPKIGPVEYSFGKKVDVWDLSFSTYEFVFDNDRSTYFKLDSNSVKNITSLDNELFLKFKKHKKVAVREKNYSINTYSYKRDYDKNLRKTVRYSGKTRYIDTLNVNWDLEAKDYILDLTGFTAAINKYIGVEAPTMKNKNIYKVANGLANVNPFNLDKYIDKFILDAKTNHNIDLSYVNKGDKLILFKELEGETIAAAYKMNDDDNVLVLVDPENWYDANQSKRWYIIYHELGHDILNLEHGECGPMMKETANGNYSWDRLEKDKNTMFETYKTKL